MSTTSIAPVIHLPLPGRGRAGDALRHWGGEVRAVEVAPGPWRLTRRGRIVVLLALAGFIAALAVLAISHTQAVAADGATPAAGPVVAVAPVAADVVVVRPGDTLWSIATRELPHLDPREAVVALRAANGISGAEIVAGQRLALPSR